MSKRKDLNSWFKSLDLKELMNIFRCPSDKEANDFIDDCDEYWDGLTLDEKEDLYRRYK